MCSRIPEHPKHAFNQVGKAGLFTPLALGGQFVDSQFWCRPTESSIHKPRPVFAESGFCAQPVSDALGRLKNCVEVVVSNQFCSAKSQYIGMHSADRKVRPKLICAALSVPQRFGALYRDYLTRRVYRQTGEGQRPIRSSPQRLESMRNLGVSLRPQRLPNKLQYRSPILTLVLPLDKLVVQPFPLRHVRRGICHLKRCRQVTGL